MGILAITFVRIAFNVSVGPLPNVASCQMNQAIRREKKKTFHNFVFFIFLLSVTFGTICLLLSMPSCPNLNHLADDSVTDAYYLLLLCFNNKCWIFQDVTCVAAPLHLNQYVQISCVWCSVNMDSRRIQKQVHVTMEHTQWRASRASKKCALKTQCGVMWSLNHRIPVASQNGLWLPSLYVIVLLADGLNLNLE